MTDAIRILIVDDHAMVREGLRAFISTRAEMAVVGEACNGLEAVSQAEALRPDVILLDLIMPRMGGIEAIHEIKRRQPQARILVITSFAEDDQVFPAIKAGAQGYLLKDSSPDELTEAIFNVYRGESALHPTIARKLIREFNRPAEQPNPSALLTAREREVLNLIAQGLSNQAIGQQLNLSEWTVRTHITNILGKLQVTNRTQAALFAIQHGLTGPGSLASMMA